MESLILPLGILNTSLQTLGMVGGKFQYQFLENADDLLRFLKERCSAEDYQQVAACMETLMKQPLRRALGRIRCVICSLEEVKRNFAVPVSDHTTDTSENK